jgi:hypothetical protein
MSDRPLIVPNLNKPLINAASMATSINGPVTIINRIPGISYDVAWTGTPTGTFSVEVSNSYTQHPDGSVANAGNWTTLPSAAFVGTLPAATGSPGNGFIDVVGTEAYAIRLVYTAASGNGSLTVLPAAKVW